MSYLIVSWNSSGSGFTRQAFPPLKHVRFPLATPGTEACDAMGGAFRPQWRELPVIVLRLSLQCCPKPVQDRCQARRITSYKRSLPTSGLIGTIRTCGQNKLHAHLFGEERVDVGFEEQWIAISSMADRDPVLTVDKNGQRHFSQVAPSKPRMAPDSSKGSAPAAFTPKRLTTRGTGQAGTQRAAEHGSITPYPTTPVALDRCRVFLRFLPLRFESD